MWTSVFLAGKRDCRRHSTTSFRENIKVAEKRYQMLEVLSFCDQVGLTSLNTNNSANFLGEKSTMKPPGMSIFWLRNTRKNLKSNIVLVVRFASSKLKGLYLLTGMPSVISLWTLADYTYDSFLHVSRLLPGIATDKMASMITWSARIFRKPVSRSNSLHGDKVTDRYNKYF